MRFYLEESDEYITIVIEGSESCIPVGEAVEWDVYCKGDYDDYHDDYGDGGSGGGNGNGGHWRDKSY